MAQGTPFSVHFRFDNDAHPQSQNIAKEICQQMKAVLSRNALYETSLPTQGEQMYSFTITPRSRMLHKFLHFQSQSDEGATILTTAEPILKEVCRTKGLEVAAGATPDMLFAQSGINIMVTAPTLQTSAHITNG